MQVSGVEIGGVVDREFPTTRIGGSWCDFGYAMIVHIGGYWSWLADVDW